MHRRGDGRYYRLTIVLLVLSMILSAGANVPNTEGAGGSFGGGDGSPGNPYVIEDVWDLQIMSSNLSAHYVLKDDIDASATSGWNSGAGFEPIGNSSNMFNGSLDGRNHTITGLYINRSLTEYVGLLGKIWSGGSVRNVDLKDCDVTGGNNTGGLVGSNHYKRPVANCSATGTVRGTGEHTGGLIGYNNGGWVSDCLFRGNVSGGDSVGGLLGRSWGLESNCSATGNVSGGEFVGGLVGERGGGIMSYCHSTGNVSGRTSVGGLAGVVNALITNCYAEGTVNGTEAYIGGLIGREHGSLHDSHATGDVTGTGILVGGLVGWASGPVNNSYATGNVSGGSYVGGLAGDNSRMISYCRSTGNVSGDGQYLGGLVGRNDEGTVFSCYANGNVNGKLHRLGGLVGLNDDGIVNSSYSTGNVAGNAFLGGLVGENTGTGQGRVFNSYATGNVSGNITIGGLTGINDAIVADCYATGNVTGNSTLGGLVGLNTGTVSNSHYNIDKVSINGKNQVTTGGLFNAQFADWTSKNLTLNISDYDASLVPSGGYFNISTIQGMKDLLGFADVANYRFRISADIDLSTSPGLYIPYFTASEFTGDNHTISNLLLNISSRGLGLIGYNGDGSINYVRVVNISATGSDRIGGLVGTNTGTVSNCHTTGKVNGVHVGGLVGFNTGVVSNSSSEVSVKGGKWAAGLVGANTGAVSDCYAIGNVTGDKYVGGLIGVNTDKVTNCYAAGNVSGTENVGGLVGYNAKDGTVSNCFWDTETSHTSASSGGTGRNTSEMKTRSTFTAAGWDFIKVWGMKEHVTYPLLIWQDDEDPVADAGDDMVVDAGTRAMLNGSASSDDFGLVNYTWSFFDGTNITLYGIVPEYRFDNLGVFVVTLIVTDARGNWHSDTVKITVLDLTPPVANAGIDQRVDEGTVVTFDGSGSWDNVGINIWTWTFTDGLLVTLHGDRPTYLFKNPGIFVVTLKVEDSKGNSNTDTMNVTVLDTVPPMADAGTDQTVDEGTLVTFNGSLSSDNVGVVNWTWTFLDGVMVTLYGEGPTYRFDDPGVFVVTLNASDADGNWDADTVAITVNDITPPEVDAGPNQHVDEGAMVTFDGSGSTDNVGIVDYTWTFTDVTDVILYGPQPNYLFVNIGTFVVTLNLSDAAGNWNTSTMIVSVNDVIAPVADAGPDRTVEAGIPIAFNGSGSSDNAWVDSYSWTFIDNGPVTLHGVLPSYTFYTPGLFEVTLTIYDGAGNWDTDTMTITVVDTTSPVADAGPDQMVDEETRVTFDGSGSSDNVGIVNWTWTFYYITFFPEDPPIKLYGETAHFTFVKPGVYNVTLTVMDARRHSHTDRMNVTVKDITSPIANAGPDQVVDEGALVKFYGLDSYDVGGIVNYTWTFEYGEQELELYGWRATYTFDLPGVYVVGLRVTDAAGHWSTDEMSVTVNDITAPLADAGPDQTVDEGSLVTFSGSNSLGEGGIVDYAWSFDPGTGPMVLQGVSPTFTFDEPGEYIVTLTVKDAIGQRGEDNLTLTVHASNMAPTATISMIIPNPARLGELVTFSAEGNDVDGTIAQYLWESDIDGILGDVVSFETDTLSPGDHNITLKVRDDDGDWSEPVKWVLAVRPNRKFIIRDMTELPRKINNDMVVIFRVVYTDPDNDAPTTLNFLFTKDDIWKAEPLMELDATDDNYVDGKEYFVNLKFKQAGRYGYIFEFENAMHPRQLTDPFEFKVEEASSTPAWGVLPTFLAIVLVVFFALTARRRDGYP